MSCSSVNARVLFLRLLVLLLIQYPGGASLPLGPLLLSNYDDILEAVPIGIIG